MIAEVHGDKRSFLSSLDEEVREAEVVSVDSCETSLMFLGSSHRQESTHHACSISLWCMS